jgi:hypothetical protein
MQPNSQHIVKLLIPHELSGLVVQSYTENGKYVVKGKDDKRFKTPEKAAEFKGNRTNRDRKTIGMFICLKAITESGVIKNYRNQGELLEQYTKKNFKTIENYIDAMEQMGLATVTGIKGSRGRGLKLASWKKLCEAYDLEFTNEFTIYNYDLNNTKQTPDYVLDGAEEAEKQERLYYRIIKKIKANHAITGFLATHYNITVINQKAIEQITRIRYDWFTNGFPSRSCSDNNFAFCVRFLYHLNTCVSRTRKKLQSNRNFLQPRRVTYLKKQLAQRGIANVSNTTLKSNQNRVPDRSIQANGFNRSERLATWFLPTEVKVTEYAVKTAPAA